MPRKNAGRMTAMSFRNQSPLTRNNNSNKAKLPPPDETGQEALYLKALGEKQTPMTVKLLDGEVVRGWIEYYDQRMIRLTREGQPNLFIFKHDIMYISEDNGRRR